MKALGIGEIIWKESDNEVSAYYCVQSTVPNIHDMEATSASFGLKEEDMMPFVTMWKESKFC